MSKVKVTRPINAVTDNAPYAGQEHYNFLKINLLGLGYVPSLVYVIGPDQEKLEINGVWRGNEVLRCSCRFSGS